MQRPELMGDQWRDVAQQRELLRSQLRFYRAEQQAIARALGFDLVSRRNQKGLAIGALRRIPLSDADVQRLRAGLELLTDADLRKRARAIDEFIAGTTTELVRLHGAQDKLIAQSSDEDLMIVMRDLVLRAAHTFTDEEFDLIAEVREKRRLEGARAAQLHMRNALYNGGPNARALGQNTEERNDDDDE